MTTSTARWAMLGIAALLLLVQPASASAACSCPGADAAGFPLGVSNPGPPLFCSYPTFPGGDPNQFFCIYDADTGALIQDNDTGLCSGSATGCTPPPSPPTCEVNGTVAISPPVTFTPSTKPNNLVFRGSLTNCTGFESLVGAKFPISAGSFTMTIKKADPGATCFTLFFSGGPKTTAKITLKFTGINPKTGKPATATKTTTVDLAGYLDQLNPFGAQALSATVADPKSPFDGRAAFLTFLYDEPENDVINGCFSKKGLAKLHFGSVVDKGVQWTPVNGPSTLRLDFLE